MPTFKLTWTIDAEGTDALDAARRVATDYFQARIAQGHPDTACVFQLTDHEGQAVTIDLSAHAAECERLRKETAVLLGNIAELEVRYDAALAKGEAMSNSHISAKTLDTDTILQIFVDTSEHTQQGDKEGYCIVREHHALAITRKLFTAMEGVNIAPAQPAAQQEPQRCQCCGYLVTESEHRGCLRAAAPQPAPSQDVAVKDELELIRAVLNGYSPCMARNDALRAVGVLLAAHDKQSGEKKS